MGRYSARTAWDLKQGELALAIAAALRAGRPLIDLTVSNPTACGFVYPVDLLEALADERGRGYDPDPRGMRSAREAVCGYYLEHGAEIDADSVVLTTSTSEAYSFLFRLLADPGDEVLVGSPGYPLFEFLSGLDGVVLRYFMLFYDHGWWIDFDALSRQVTPRTRALVLVHPNNPTGHATRGDERARLEAFCAEHGLALIVDEVFLDYGLRESVTSFACGEHQAETYVVSGLSKVAALPQMKVAWIAAVGPGRGEALERLEVIADTFLSLGAPAQLALRGWLQGRGLVAGQILERVRENLHVLESADGLAVLPVEAGWAAMARLPQVFGAGEGEPSLTLLKRAGVVTHPGSFYGMAGSHYLVVSLLVSAEAFRAGVDDLSRAATVFGKLMD